MKFNDLEPGVYQASLIDWGLELVEKLNNLPKAVLQFEIDLMGGPETVKGRFEGLFETKDGKPNKKTLQTIVLCGFGYSELDDLNREDALDTSHKYSITIEREGEYNKIAWVNLPGGAALKKQSTGKKMTAAMKAALNEAKKEHGRPKMKAEVKNHAEDLPF